MPFSSEALALTSEQRADLEETARSQSLPAAFVLRAKILLLLAEGWSYQAIADTTCSATTIRDRRDEWIQLGVFARLKQIALESYDRIVGLLLDQIAIDGSITKAPGSEEIVGRWSAGSSDRIVGRSRRRTLSISPTRPCASMAARSSRAMSPVPPARSSRCRPGRGASQSISAALHSR